MSKKFEALLFPPIQAFLLFIAPELNMGLVLYRKLIEKQSILF